MSNSSDLMIRKLRKKLRQIETLERMERTLSEEEELKIDAKEDIRLELLKLVKSKENIAALTKEIDNSMIAPPIDEPTEAKSNFCEIDQHPEIVQSVTSTENCFSDDGSTPPFSTDDLKSNFCVSDSVDDKLKVVKQTNEGISGNLTKTSSPVLKSTKKSQRGRIKDEISSVQTDSKINSLSEAFFQDLNLKMSVLEGHDDYICAVDLFGDFIVSGGRDTCLKLWCVKANEEIKSLGGHNGTITGIRFLVDKEFINYPNVVTSSYDCTLRVWDLEEGKIIKSIYVYSPVLCIDYHKSVVAVGTEAGKLELYNIESGENLFSVNAYDESVSAVKILSDCRLAVGSSNGILKVYNTLIDTKEPEFSVNHSIKIQKSNDCNNASNHYLNLSKISCITSYKDFIFYGDEGYNIKIVNFSKGELQKARNNVKEFCPSEVLEVAKVQGREYLFSVGFDVDNGDGYVNIRTLPDLKYLGTIQDIANNSGPITCMRIEEVDSLVRLVTGGAQLRIWDQIKKKNTRKRKGSTEDATLIPCKYICTYNEIKDSEPESDSDESQPELSVKSSSSEKPPTGQTWCSIL